MTILRPELNKQFKPIFGSGYRLNPDHPLNKGLVAWWLMNERAGSQVYNLRNTNNGTITTATNAFGQYGPMLTFGANAWIDVPKGNQLDDLGPLTISALIYPTTLDATYRRIVDKRTVSGTTNGHIVFCAASTTLYYEIDPVSGNTPSRLSATGVLATNNWYRVVITWDGTFTGTGIKFYSNGVETAYGASASGTTAFKSDAAYDLFIGNNSANSRAFIGSIADVAIWNRVLASKEVMSYYLFPFGTPDNPRLLFPSTKRYFYPSAATIALFRRGMTARTGARL